MAGLDDYKFGNKNHYRRQVWGSLRSIIRRGIAEGALLRHTAFPHQRFRPTARGLSEAHVALLPSSQGVEIAVAESMGFARRNIHAIDRSPAKIAWAARRYPGIHTYGCAVSQAMRRIAGEQELSGVNLDLCGAATEANRAALEGVASTMAVRHAVGLTVFRGRERGPRSAKVMMDDQATRAWCRDTILPVMRRRCVTETLPQETDAVRLWFMLHAFDLQPNLEFVILDRTGIYRSTSARGRHTMLWVTLDLSCTSLAYALAFAYKQRGEPQKARRWARKWRHRRRDIVYCGPVGRP